MSRIGEALVSGVRRHHTVLVMGGGPAGSSAAHTLASLGVDVGLIDKAIFPRAKLCGGLLTMRSRKVFARVFGDAAWDQAHEHECAGIRLFHRDRCLSDVDGHKPLYFTNRYQFDDYLLSLAKARGCAMYLGDGVASIDLTQRLCKLQSGAEFSFDYLIGADGVNSLVARTLFGASYDRSKIAFALEMDVDRALLTRAVDRPEIYFGIVNWGYGWVFPKRDTVTVGVGGIQARNPNMKRDFEAFLLTLFGTMPPGKIKGHHLPFGDYKREPGRDRVLLVGDAAGLVEPITGEGIAFAMQSGHEAALAVQAALQADGRVRALPLYQARSREITRALDHANRLRYLVFPKFCERLFVRMLPSSSITHLHLDLMADDIAYGDYARRLSKRLLKRVISGRLS